MLVVWGSSGDGYFYIALFGLAVILTTGTLIGLTIHWLLPRDSDRDDAAS